MANRAFLLKISSNLETPQAQSNQKSFPIGNEFHLTADCSDEKQLEFSKMNPETEITKETWRNDSQDADECLKAEKLLKALLSIHTEEMVANDGNATEDFPHSTIAAADSEAISKPGVSSPRKLEYPETNSNDLTDYPPASESKTRRRRKRKARKSKANDTDDFYAEDSNVHSTADHDVKLMTSGSKLPSSTTCSSSIECVDVVQSTGVELRTESSDSAISQDEHYHDLITEEFILDLEQRMIKENLFIEYEKLAKEVSAFELELHAQLEKSEAMEQSLRQLRSDNTLLNREKNDLVNKIKTKEDEVATLKEQVTSLRVTCEELSQWKESKDQRSYIELDSLKSLLLAKEDEIEVMTRKHHNEYKELTKNHGMFLAEVLKESQEINKTLFAALRSSAKSNNQLHKTNNVLQLLSQLKQDVLTLSDKSSVLEITVQQLRDEAESQAKTLMKVNNEKRSLKEQLVDVDKKNKALVKEKAKLEREKQTLKAEATRAKSMSQTCKARLEEFKANARSAKREKELVQHEKLDLEVILKNLGVDHKALMLNGKNTRSKEENLDNAEEHPPPILERSFEDLKQMKPAMHCELQTPADVARQIDASPHDTSNRGETNEPSRKLVEIFTRIAEDRLCLKQITELAAQDLNVEKLADTFHFNCGCYNSETIRKEYLENIPLLTCWLESLAYKTNPCMQRIGERELNSRTVSDGLAKKLEQFRCENSSLKQDLSKHTKSLENYKELVRGYSHIVHELEERIVGVREMKCINRELEKYSVLLEKQKERIGIRQVEVCEGFSLIHVMFQRLKRFTGNSMNTELSIHSSEFMEATSLETLEQSNRFSKEKLAHIEYNVSLLKATLERKRMEATEIQRQVCKALLDDGNQLSTIESAPELEQKMCREGKESIMLEKQTNDVNQGMIESKSAPLSEKQLAVVIDLVQCEEQLVVGIQESVDLEKRLERLGNSSRDYMKMLLGKDSRFAQSSISNASDRTEANFSFLNSLKEKERIENEFSFKEAQIRLLEKQLTLLKSERKACLKALRRYQKEMKGIAQSSMISAYTGHLSRLDTFGKEKLMVNGVKDYKENIDISCQPAKTTVFAGSNV